MPPLRIGYFLPPYPQGGIARHVLALVDHMRARHSVIVFCESRAKTLHDSLDQRGMSPRIIEKYPAANRGVLRPLIENWAPVLEARNAFRAERLDIVHFHAGRLGAIYPGVVASRLAGIPRRLLTLHNTVAQRSPLQRFFEARLIGSLDRIVAVSAAVKDDIVRKKNAVPEEVAVIVNGIDVSEFDTAADAGEIRAELGLEATAEVIGAVGRLQYDKGFDVLIRALALLRPRQPTLRLVLIGSGRDEAGLRELAERERVADVVHFAGYRSDARRLMRALDIVAIPSRREGQSFTLLEAMAARKPVVAANVGGIPEVLIDGVTGLLFPSENVAALANALEKLLNDPERRAAMGRAARDRVAREFTETAMVQKTAELYEEAMK